LINGRLIIQDHPEGYIEWTEFERNQKLLAANPYGKAGGAKSGRGGRALLPGVPAVRGLRLPAGGGLLGTLQLTDLSVRATQPDVGTAQMLDLRSKRVDTAIVGELLLAIQPIAVEATLHAEHRYMEQRSEQQRIVELELQRARHEASLAERRYEACDPENRLIAAQLEKSWEMALQRVQDCEVRLAALQRAVPAAPTPDFTGLAADLDAAWNAPGVTMRSRQQLVRTLIADIAAGYDVSTREIILTTH
jgi:hypothetical protein